MFIDLITLAINVGFVAVIVLVIMARRWEEQHNEFLRLAGWIGLTASIGALLASLVLVLDPEWWSWSLGYVILVLMSVFVPALALTGALLVLKRRRRGVRLMLAGSVLWLISVIFGYIGAALLKA